jgi:hypothetical protein
MKLDIDSECCRNLVNGDVDLDRQNPCWSDTSGFLTNVRGNSVMEGQYFSLRVHGYSCCFEGCHEEAEELIHPSSKF